MVRIVLLLSNYIYGELDSGSSDQGVTYRGHVEQRLYAHGPWTRPNQIHSLEYHYKPHIPCLFRLINMVSV